MKVKPKKSEQVKQPVGKCRDKEIQINQAPMELREEVLGEPVPDHEDVLDDKGYKTIKRPAVRNF